MSVQKYIVKDYFKKEKFVLKAVGVSFTGDESIAYKIYAVVSFFLIVFLYPALDIREIFINDFDAVSDMIVYAFGTILGLIKTIVLLRHRIKFGKVLDKLEKEPFAVNLERGGEEEDKLIKNCVRITTVQTLVYWVAINFTMASTLLYSLIERLRSSDPNDWILPYGPLHISNVSYSPNYEIVWFYQNLSVIFIGTHFVTIDLLVAAFIAHISCQFQMLQNNLRRMVTNSYIEMQKNKCSSGPSSLNETKILNTNIEASTIPWQYLHNNLKNAVDYHLAILDMAKEMEYILSDLLMIVFLGTLVILCFLVFHSTKRESSLSTIRHLGEAFSACFQVLIVCYWGEQVVFESQQVGNAVYEANFVGADLRFQKSLVLITRRSRNYTKLTAGKFTDICLATFTWIMRTSYSAFMVLRSTNNEAI